MTDRIRAAHARDSAARLAATARRAEVTRMIAATAPRLVEAAVVSVIPGAAVDGSSLIIVRYDDADIEAAWLGEVAPTSGTTVLVVVYNHTPYILGRLNGVPPE